MENKKMLALIVEDEKSIAHLMLTLLEANNYNVQVTASGNDAIRAIAANEPDVVLLDLGLPDIDGLNVLENVRNWSNVPIIVVSARGREREKVQALDLGADDYITKPFGTAELLARIRAALRHSERTTESHIEDEKTVIGNLVVDRDRHTVLIENKPVSLTQIEYKIISLIAKYAGRVLTYDYIIENVWGSGSNKDNQLLRVNMANIRRKIEKNPAEPQYIITEIGVGYRMNDD